MLLKGGFQIRKRTRGAHKHFKRSTHLFTISYGQLHYVSGVSAGNCSFKQRAGKSDECGLSYCYKPWSKFVGFVGNEDHIFNIGSIAEINFRTAFEGLLKIVPVSHLARTSHTLEICGRPVGVLLFIIKIMINYECKSHPIFQKGILQHCTECHYKYFSVDKLLDT